MDNKDIQYINYEEAINVYNRMIAASGGGFRGIKDEGSIRAVLGFIKNDDYYPDFTDKLTYLVFGFCSGHFFYDGNKRIALTIGTYFLHKNGYMWEACVFMRQLEAIIYHVAASNIDKDLLLRIISAFMSGKDYDEELKIDIAKAMNNGSLNIQEDDD